MTNPTPASSEAKVGRFSEKYLNQVIQKHSEMYGNRSVVCVALKELLSLRSESERDKERIVRLKEALEFYANEFNYVLFQGSDFKYSKASKDDGVKARNALKAEGGGDE